MPVKQTKKTLYGSGKIYSTNFVEGEFPVVADFKKLTTQEATKIMEYCNKVCVAANRIGLLKGGYQFQLSTETMSDQDDLGEQKVDVIKKETGTSSFKLFNVDGETIASQYPTATYGVSDAGDALTAIGGLEHLDETIHVIIFHRIDKKNGDAFVIAAGQNISGLTVGFNPDSVTPLDVSIACEPLNDKGNLVWMFEPAKQGVSTLNLVKDDEPVTNDEGTDADVTDENTGY